MTYHDELDHLLTGASTPGEDPVAGLLRQLAELPYHSTPVPSRRLAQVLDQGSATKDRVIVGLPVHPPVPPERPEPPQRIWRLRPTTATGWLLRLVLGTSALVLGGTAAVAAIGHPDAPADHGPKHPHVVTRLPSDQPPPTAHAPTRTPTEQSTEHQATAPTPTAPAAPIPPAPGGERRSSGLGTSSDSGGHRSDGGSSGDSSPPSGDGDQTGGDSGGAAGGEPSGEPSGSTGGEPSATSGSGDGATGGGDSTTTAPTGHEPA